MLRFFLKLFFFLAGLLITAHSSKASIIAAYTGVKTYNNNLLQNIVPNEHLNATDTIIAPVEENNSDLKSKISYSANDSMVIDMVNQKAYLYNNAVVLYEDVKLEAGYIELDFGKNIIYAKGIKDSTGNIVQKPVSTQAGEKFNAGEIAYNFKSKKGKIKDVITQQGDGYIHGQTIKKDSTDIYYVANGKYTTCDLEHPHFYIEAKKIKVIPNDRILTAPAELYIADIPTPLVLPFGFFPNKKGRASGILPPTYGESNQWGFFLKDGGFYFGNNDKVDLALRGDIYSNGSFGVQASSNYNNRYQYNGLFTFKYSRIIDGDKELPNAVKNNVFSIQWNHIQDTKANPNRRFSANVNAASSSYNKFNGNVATGAYLTNTMQSNISFSRTFPGTPFSFSANARHSQNTITKRVDLSLPELTLNMTRIYPFKNNSRVGTKWYDKVGISATANARNEIHTYDSLLLKNNTISNMQNGLEFRIPISTSLNVLKYFTFSPSISAHSVVYKESIYKYYDPESKQANIDTLKGVKMANDYSIQGTLNTRLYGDYFFRTKRLKQIRHVATPSVTASYRPDFSENQYGYYHTVQTDSTGTTAQYSIFQNGIYGSPASGPSGLISLALNNTLEAKIRQKTDSGSVDKKVSVIDNLNISTSYNLAAKSFNWGAIGISGRTKLFKKLDVNSILSMDPYQVDSTGKRIEQFEWEKKKVGRITSASLALGTSLKAAEKTNSTNNGAKTTTVNTTTPNDYSYIISHPDAYVDFNIPWNINAYYNLSYSKPGLTATTTQAITYNASVFLTQNWQASVTSGYDLTNRKVTVTSVNIHRNLHCWELNFTWVPFGFRQSFMLNINVKSSTLSDLKLTRKKDWYDYQ